MAVLCILLSAVCLADYRTYRIPNALILVILLYGMGYRYRDTGGFGPVEYLMTGLTVLLLLYPLFRIGVLGAGDVKLFGVTAGYLSWQKSFCFLFISLLVAAILSVFRLMKERNVKERLEYLCAYLLEIGRTGRFGMYFEDRAMARDAGICLAGPVLVSWLLHVGGVY